MRRFILLFPAVLLLGGDHSSEHRYDEQTHVLALTCVGEATFHIPDCAPIAAVLQHRTRKGQSIVPMAKKYASVFKGEPVGRKEWVLALPNGFERPHDWPEEVQPWVMVRDRWKATLKHAHRLIRARGEVHNCSGKPWHWGASYGVDDRRARKAVAAGRWAKIECPGTQNLFYEKGPRYASRSRRKAR